jgi:hypothetical protein
MFFPQWCSEIVFVGSLGVLVELRLYVVVAFGEVPVKIF